MSVHSLTQYVFYCTIDTSVTPSSVTRLSIPPYDIFSLNCVVVISPITNMYSVTHSWPQEDIYGVGNVISSGLESNLTVDITDGISSGTSTFTCTANVTITGVTCTAMPTDSATVTVKGIFMYPIYEHDIYTNYYRSYCPSTTCTWSS